MSMSLLFPMLFADNTIVFLNGKHIYDFSITMNEELGRLYIWLKENKLPLNVNKTHYRVFRFKPAKYLPIQPPRDILSREHYTYRYPT